MSTDRTFDNVATGNGNEFDTTMHPAVPEEVIQSSNSDGTLRPANMDGTMRPTESFDGTVRTDNSAKMQDNFDDNFFTLKGVKYRNIRNLSDNSGEAQVFLVEKNGEEFVLKIYYPNFEVDKKILQTVLNFDFEMIVRVFDYGKTYVDGKRRYYELMEYLRGGTMADYRLNGDMDKFRRIALQGAAALAYCHEYGILHKYVKPSNLFFRDKERTELVLGDFGISSMLEQDGKAHKTTQARTPIYAAPEMYADVIDGVVEISPAADFYSLGIGYDASEE